MGAQLPPGSTQEKKKKKGNKLCDEGTRNWMRRNNTLIEASCSLWISDSSWSAICRAALSTLTPRFSILDSLRPTPSMCVQVSVSITFVFITTEMDETKGGGFKRKRTLFLAGGGGFLLNPFDACRARRTLPHAHIVGRSAAICVVRYDGR